MTSRVEFTRRASREYHKLPPHDQPRIQDRINTLKTNPRPPGSEKVTGPEDLYRVRTGNYRIVYSIEDDQLLVLVIMIGHRRAVYRNIGD